MIMQETIKTDVFRAIADPTRREIINLLVHQSLNLNAIAEKFPISRPAISRHIKVLTRSGLVVIRQKGKERFCEAQPQNLAEVAGWLDPYRAFWSGKLDALGDFLAKETSPQNDLEETIKPKKSKAKAKGKKSKRSKKK